jgi:hypothetical protein
LTTPPAKPVITPKEARKLLGELAKDTTNEELVVLISSAEQMIRILLADYMVRKNHVVS